MADTAVDTTATAEVTAKVRFIQFYFFRLNRRVKRFGELFRVVVLFVLTIGLASSVQTTLSYSAVEAHVTVSVTSCELKL